MENDIINKTDQFDALMREKATFSELTNGLKSKIRELEMAYHEQYLIAQLSSSVASKDETNVPFDKLTLRDVSNTLKQLNLKNNSSISHIMHSLLNKIQEMVSVILLSVT